MEYSGEVFHSITSSNSCLIFGILFDFSVKDSEMLCTPGGVRKNACNGYKNMAGLNIINDKIMINRK